MGLRKVINFCLLSAFLLAACLWGFSTILLSDVPYYNFKDYVLPPIILICSCYAFFVFLLAWFFKSKRGFTLTILLLFTVVFLFAAFQISFEARSEFGATWLSSEVFSELLVQQGKGLYILLVGLFISMISTKIATTTDRVRKIGKNP